MLKKIMVVHGAANTVSVLKSYLEESNFMVYEANSGRQALNLLGKVLPSLIILDTVLPDISCEKICGLLRNKCASPIIILSSKANEEDILNGYSMGADDYVTKPFSPRQLKAKIEAWLRRTSEESISISQQQFFSYGDLHIDTSNHKVKKNSDEIKLTPSEYKLLVSMMRNSKAFTREELLTVVYGNDYKGTDRVIDTHIKNLRQKIETDPKSPQYILTVVGIGYRFDRR